MESKKVVRVCGVVLTAIPSILFFPPMLIGAVIGKGIYEIVDIVSTVRRRPNAEDFCRQLRGWGQTVEVGQTEGGGPLWPFGFLCRRCERGRLFRRRHRGLEL